MSIEEGNNGSLKAATKIGDTTIMEVERAYLPKGEQRSLYQFGSTKPRGIEKTLNALAKKGVVFDITPEKILLGHDAIAGIQYEVEEGTFIDRFSEVIFLKGDVGLTPTTDVFPELSPEAPYEFSSYDHQTPDGER